MNSSAIIFILAICFVAASKLQESITNFLDDLVRLLKWKRVVLIYCSVGDIVHWSSNLSKLTYVQFEKGALPLTWHETDFPAPVIVLPSCSPSFSIMMQANHSMQQTTMFSWWIFVADIASEPDGSGSDVLNKFSSLKVDITSNVNIVTFGSSLVEEGLQIESVIWNVYKQMTSNSLCLDFIGQWYYFSPEKSGWKSQIPVISFKTRLIARSHNLDGVTLRVGVLVGKPDYNFDCKVEQDKKGQIINVEGYSAHILKALIYHLKFNGQPKSLQDSFLARCMKFVPQVKKKTLDPKKPRAHPWSYNVAVGANKRVEFIGSDTWGSQDDEGVWAGLVGLLADDIADLILCHPTITAERTTAALFLHSTLHSRRSLAYRAEGLPLTQDVFLLTFTGSLWLVCFAITLVLMAASFRFASLQTSKHSEGETKSWTWVEITLWAVAATCQQGYSKEPEGVSCKVIFLAGYITSYLLCTWFAAGVTSLLAVQGKDTHLQLSDVVQMGVDFCASWDGLLPDFFQNSADPAAQSLYLHQLRYKHTHKVQNLDLLFLQLQGEKKVGMASENSLKHYMATILSPDISCQLTLSPVSGTSHLKAWAVRRRSRYADILNYWLLRLREAGILHVGLKRSMLAPASCGGDPGYSSLGLGHVMSALGILGSGIAASFVLLIAEMIWHYYKATRQRQALRRKRASMRNF